MSQRDALEAARPRSSTEIDKVARTTSEVPRVPHVSLSPNAEVFRPRSNTVPTEPLSRSLPTTVPESPARHRMQGSRTPKRKDVKVAPRFFPAYSKEKMNQVREHLYDLVSYLFVVIFACFYLRDKKRDYYSLHLYQFDFFCYCVFSSFHGLIQMIKYCCFSRVHISEKLNTVQILL